MDAAPVFAAIAGAFLLAGFVKGVIGLGLPTVSIGLLGLLMTPAQAAAILVVPSLVTNVWQAAVGGSLLALARRLWPLLTGTCIGTVIGVALLPRDGNGRATMWLGLALVVYAALGLVKVQFAVPRHAETWLGLLMGVATGAITVATGIFVMPGTPYIQSLEFDRDRLVQALGLSSRFPQSRLRQRSLTPDTCKNRWRGRQLWRLPRHLLAWAWDNSRAAESRPKRSGYASLSG
ncbi:MAG: sulfite exporter TauE/SafE family protein [Pseudolabrys sp.]